MSEAVLGKVFGIEENRERDAIHDEDLGFDTPDECFSDGEMRQFWTHYQKITGEIVPLAPDEQKFFRCAC